MRTKFIVISGIMLVGLILIGFLAKDGISQWVKQERVKRDVILYLVTEEGEQDGAARSLYKRLASQKDILSEFCKWLQTRRYPEKSNGAIAVQGYTARKLAEITAGRVNPFEIYNYLVSLRIDPRKTVKALDEEFGILPVVATHEKSSQAEPVSDSDREKMKQKVMNYVICEENEQAAKMEKYYQDFAKHEDILKEFYAWIETKRYRDKEQGAVIVNGYSAKRLAKIFKGLPVPYVYYELIDLRKEPDDVDEYLKKSLLEREKNEKDKKIYFDAMRRKFNAVEIQARLKLNRETAPPAIEMNAKMLPLKRDIMVYLTVEKNETESKAIEIFNRFARYETLLKEFHGWVKTKHYPTESEGALVFYGYSAKRIATECQGYLDPVDVYQYLVDLREKNRTTLGNLKCGLQNIIE